MRLVYELRGGYAPTKNHSTDAGWDLRSAESRTMMPGETHTFDLRIAFQWWDYYKEILANDVLQAFGLQVYGRLAPKSGLARDFGVDVLGGVVECEYTGNVGVVITRPAFTKDGSLIIEPWIIKPGDMICQVVPTIIPLVIASEPGELIPTDRGSKGFGSGGR